MKIVFDEHCPPVLVEVFKTLANKRHILKSEIFTAKEFTGHGEKNNDAPWLRRFADVGGNVVITGDHGIRSKPHQQLALSQCGFVSFFFAKQWNHHSNFKRTAVLLFWWPEVQNRIQQSSPGDWWEIPYGLRGKFKNVSRKQQKSKKK